MGLFTKKADPITSKAKAIDDEIAKLQLEIKKLNRNIEKPEPARPRTNGDSQPTQFQERPVVRSTATPHGARALPARPAPVRDPIFEAVDQAPPSEADPSKAHYNDLGVRKYDLPAAWRRIIGYFRGPSTHNPKLVSYLAAGSIRGLRPLRYEKRVARNRFIVMTVFFLVILYWLLALLWRHR